MADIFPADNSDSSVTANRHLWIQMMIRGGDSSWYHPDGFNSDFEASAALNHVLACGIDESNSIPTEHSSWESFAGTFAENHDQHEGLTARIACRCDEVRRMDVHWFEKWSLSTVMTSPLWFV